MPDSTPPTQRMLSGMETLSLALSSTGASPQCKLYVLVVIPGLTVPSQLRFRLLPSGPQRSARPGPTYALRGDLRREQLRCRRNTTRGTQLQLPLRPCDEGGQPDPSRVLRRLGLRTGEVLYQRFSFGRQDICERQEGR